MRRGSFAAALDRAIELLVAKHAEAAQRWRDARARDDRVGMTRWGDRAHDLANLAACFGSMRALAAAGRLPAGWTVESREADAAIALSAESASLRELLADLTGRIARALSRVAGLP